MTVTRQARKAAYRWKEMSGDCQQKVNQPSWDLTPDQWWTLGGAQKWMMSRSRVFWDQELRDVWRLVREGIPPASHPSLSCHVLFTEENIVDPQETVFVKTEEQRSRKQEVRVLAPRLKKPSVCERAELQSLLDLTDWRGLHLVFRPNLSQHPREWAPPDHFSGSHFRVETSVAIQTTPSLPQLESLRRFVVNSLLVEIRSTHVPSTWRVHWRGLTHLWGVGGGYEDSITRQTEDREGMG